MLALSLTTDIGDIFKEDSNSVAFSGQKRSGGNFDGKITFDNSLVNIGGGFDPVLGEFTAPLTTFYVFTLSAMTGTVKGHTSITVHKNEAILFHIHEGDVENGQNRISFSWIEEMNFGDTLKLFVVSNYLYANEENFVSFHGFSLVV